MSALIDRRRHCRFELQPMYTPVSVRPMRAELEEPLEGHAYDISEGGLRFELDHPLPIGEPVAVQVTLPALAHSDPGPGRTILAFATVVWHDDDPDEPGPARMAATFDHFAHAGDRDRLLKHFATGRYRLAA